MSFRNQDLRLLDRQLQKFYLKHLSSRTESLRQRVLDSPTQSPSYLERFDLTRLSLPVKKLRELQTLAIVSWYCPDEVRLLIQLELESTWLTRNPDDAKEILLTSKDLALCWLLTMSKWNESDFYGNNLTKSFVQKFSLIDFRRRPTSHVDRYTGYCRGYQDAHRGAPSSLGTEHWARTSVAEDLWQQFLSEVKRSLLFQQCSRNLLYLYVRQGFT